AGPTVDAAELPARRRLVRGRQRVRPTGAAAARLHPDVETPAAGADQLERGVAGDDSHTRTVAPREPRHSETLAHVVQTSSPTKPRKSGTPSGPPSTSSPITLAPPTTNSAASTRANQPRRRDSPPASRMPRPVPRKNTASGIARTSPSAPAG